MAETDRMQVSAEDAARRLRAAQGWSGMKDAELAAQLGVSVRTLGRMKKSGGDVGYERRLAIAAACDVPQWFMEQGFDVAVAREEEATIAERVEALESQMQLMIRAGLVRAGAAAAQARSSEEPDATPATPATQGHSR